jgi:hypothetical protein
MTGAAGGAEKRGDEAAAKAGRAATPLGGPLGSYDEL